MRKELYNQICERVSTLRTTPEGDIQPFLPGDDIPEGWVPLVKHLDLWNHNVEFIEQEEAWERPAVFIEFSPIEWDHPVKGHGDFRGHGTLLLHIVTDWQGSTSAGSVFRSAGLHAFDIIESVVREVCGLEGECFGPLVHSQSLTNHSHEDLVENIESFTFKCYHP